MGPADSECRHTITYFLQKHKMSYLVVCPCLPTIFFAYDLASIERSVLCMLMAMGRAISALHAKYSISSISPALCISVVRLIREELFHSSNRTQVAATALEEQMLNVRFMAKQ